MAFNGSWWFLEQKVGIRYLQIEASQGGGSRYS